LCGTGAILLRFLARRIDPTFMSFQLISPESISWLRTHAVGAVMPNLNETVLRRLPLLVPPLDEQKQMGFLLGALDDKIDLNRRVNETLEAMARAIFKSWFVDFDPVRAKMEGREPAGMDAETAGLFPCSFETTECGPIPTGWRVVSLPEAIEVNPNRRLDPGLKAPYLDMQSMPTSGHRAETWIEREFASGMRFINGDTLVARITPCLENGKTAFVDFLVNGQVGWGSTEYIVLRPRPPLSPEFGYYLARTDDFRTFAIQNMSGTSGRQRVPSSCLHHYPLVVPSVHVARRFGALARSFMDLISKNSEQSATLAAMRDTLLPKLLSGEIRIKDAEKDVEAHR